MTEWQRYRITHEVEAFVATGEEKIWTEDGRRTVPAGSYIVDDGDEQYFVEPEIFHGLYTPVEGGKA